MQGNPRFLDASRTMRRIACLALLPLAIATGSSSAWAVRDALVDEAVRLVEAGQFQGAFDRLVPQETERAGDPDFDLVLGIAANEVKQHSRAVFALERVLTAQPENARARAELGRALLALGDTRAARESLEIAARQSVPVGVKATLDQFLQAVQRVEDSRRTAISAYLDATLGYDTNVNSGPAGSNVAVPAFGGAVFTLSPGATHLRAGFFGLGGGVAVRHPLSPRTTIIGNANGSWRGHDTAAARAFDLGSLDVSAGVRHRADRHDFGLVAQAGTIAIDYNRFREQVGVVGEYSYLMSGYDQASAYVQYTRLTYPTQTIRDADRTVVGGTYSHTFRNNWSVFGGAYAGREDERGANVPHLGHELLGVRGGVLYPINDRWSAFGSAGYEDRRYGGPDPLFLTTRHDKQLNLTVGAAWTPAKTWRVTPQLAVIRNESNIQINDYKRTTVSVTARKDF